MDVEDIKAMIEDLSDDDFFELAEWIGDQFEDDSEEEAESEE